MSRTSKDLIASLVAGAAIMAVFASFELVENLYELTRAYEDFELDEILVCIPALAIVATWFAVRRWREVAGLNRTLDAQARELGESLEQRQAMEAQLREGYKVAAMGTLGGGFAGELERVLEPIETLAREGLDPSGAHGGENARLTRIVDAARGGRAIVERMLAFGDGGMRETEPIVALDGVRESISLAKDAIDATLEVEYRATDHASRIRVNRWELHEVGAQLVANAVDAAGPGRRIRVRVERTSVDERAAREQGLAPGDFVRVAVEDAGPGVPPGLQGHVFEPFFTTKGAGDGKGLGLAIAYSLVRGWNANLLLRSEPGHGASFEMLIPVHEPGGR